MAKQKNGWTFNMALSYSPAPDLGNTCPDFQLPGVDGKLHQLSDLQKGKPFLIVFMCNHCPYVKAVEDRLINLGMDLAQLSIPMVGISSNDAKDYPEDSYPSMKLQWEKKRYTFPYLYDESQTVAKLFGAVCTPDFFLYDQHSRLSYRGRLDDSWKDASKVTRRDLYEAAKTLANGGALTQSQAPSMGCSIKWKEHA
jgi:peroxiredoxin